MIRGPWLLAAEIEFDQAAIHGLMGRQWLSDEFYESSWYCLIRAAESGEI